jgi:hypothetical protein
MAKAGRHPKLNEEVQKRIVDAIALGNYLDTAAQYGGINPSTFHRWMEKGSRDDAEEPYASFYEAVENAKAAAEVRAVARIQAAANDGTWQAAAWWLERTRPKKFGRFDRSEVSGPEGGPVRLDVSTDDLERKISAILSRRESDGPSD